MYTHEDAHTHTHTIDERDRKLFDYFKWWIWTHVINPIKCWLRWFQNTIVFSSGLCYYLQAWLKVDFNVANLSFSP